MYKSKEDGKDQDSIKSNTTPDPEHHMKKLQKHKEITYKRAVRSVLSQQVITRQDGLIKTKEPVHEISNKVLCATSKTSDQPAHTRSLIRAFTSRLSVL